MKSKIRWETREFTYLGFFFFFFLAFWTIRKQATKYFVSSDNAEHFFFSQKVILNVFKEALTKMHQLKYQKENIRRFLSLLSSPELIHAVGDP